MIQKFTLDQMVNEWRLRRGLCPLRADADSTRVDGFDTESLLKAKILDWYASMLDSAPPNMLPVSDIAESVSMSVSDDGIVTIPLPDSCRRVISVRLDSWLTDATPIAADQNPAIVALQRSGYVRGSSYAPVAIYSPHQLTLYSADSQSPTLTSLRCIAVPPDGSIIISRSALNSIPNDILNF